jgi:hypothetical protein
MVRPRSGVNGGARRFWREGAQAPGPASPPRDPFQPQILFRCGAFGPRTGRFRGFSQLVHRRFSQLVHRHCRERGASSRKRPKERRFFGPRRLREPLVERRQRKALGKR